MAARKSIKIRAIHGYWDKETGEWINDGTEYTVSDKRLKEMKEFPRFDEFIQVVESKSTKEEE